MTETLKHDQLGIGVPHHASLRHALSDPKIYLLSFAHFTFIGGTYVITFWLPTIIKGFGITDPMRIGLLTALPYIASAIGMVIISKHFNKTRERRWHTAVCAFVSAAGLVVATFLSDDFTWALLALANATIGIPPTMQMFWKMPTAYLSGAAAAGGNALINSL